MIKELPNIGLGTYLIKDKRLLKGSIKAALKAGYKHIDTAQAYANESHIGEILKELKVDRSKLFITTKVHPLNYKYHTAKSTLESIKKLKLKQVDLVLLHVGVEDETNISAFKELMRLRAEGKIRHIGVSNFTIGRIKAIKKATGEYPYCNQISLSPLERATKIEKFCKKKNIALTGYSIMIPYFEAGDKLGVDAFTKEQKTILVNMAKVHKKDVGQILNRWALHIGYNVIPKSKTPSRVLSNIKLMDFELTNDELKIINGWNLLNQKAHTIKQENWAGKITDERYKKGFK